jgi:hypothetical protein
VVIQGKKSKAKQGKAWLDKARQGVARHNKAWIGKARRV